LSSLPGFRTVTAAGSSVQARNRRLDIQGLRAIAVGSVVAFHAGLPLPGGFTGVDVFFVVSGFVITAMLMRESQASGRISFPRFFGRRFQRLTPGLALMVGVTVVASIVFQSPFGQQQATASTAFGAMLLCANFVIEHVSGMYFAPAAETNPLLNTWSLSVEEQFYLIFPFVLMAGWWLARRGRALAHSPLVLVSALFIASGAMCFVSWSGLASDLIPAPLLGFYSPLTRAWEFAAGSLLALLLPNRKLVAPAMATVLGALGLLLLALGFLRITGQENYPGPLTLLPVIGTMLLLVAGTQHLALTSRLLSLKPFTSVGDLSYSWYLWHWPFIVFAVALFPDTPRVAFIAAIASLAPSLISYHFVEQPIRVKKLMNPSQRGRLATLVLVPPLALAATLWIGSNHEWWLGWTQDRAVLVAEQAAEQRDCVDVAFAPQRCTWNAEASNGNVLLVGDSQAYAFADGVIQAADSLNLSTTVSSQSGCPFILGGTASGVGVDCPEWQQQILKYALDTRPEVVVIANRSAGYVNRDWQWVPLIDADGTTADTSEKAAQVWQRDLDGVVRQLREAGIGVVIMNSIADVDDRVDRRSLFSRFVSHESVGTVKATRALAEQVRADAIAAERQVARANPGTQLVDPLTTLCDQSVCPNFHDGQPLYVDFGHVTRLGSLALTPNITSALRSAMS